MAISPAYQHKLWVNRVKRMAKACEKFYALIGLVDPYKIPDGYTHWDDAPYPNIFFDQNHESWTVQKMVDQQPQWWADLSEQDKRAFIRHGHRVAV